MQARMTRNASNMGCIVISSGTPRRRVSARADSLDPFSVGSAALARPPGEDGEGNRADAFARVADAQNRVRVVGRKHFVELRLGELLRRRWQRESDSEQGCEQKAPHSLSAGGGRRLPRGA